LITKFSDSNLELLTKENPYERLAFFDEIVTEIACHPVDIKPDYQFELVPPQKKKFCDRRKRILR
jgi:hypothetical protein